METNQLIRRSGISFGYLGEILNLIGEVRSSETEPDLDGVMTILAMMRMHEGGLTEDEVIYYTLEIGRVLRLDKA